MQVLDRSDVFEFHRPLDEFWLGSQNTGFKPRKDFVDLLHQKPKVMANLSIEHWGDSDYPMCQYMHDVMISHPNFVILSHNPDHDRLRPNILYFPFWLGETKTRLAKSIQLLSHDAKSRYLGLVNNQARPHRVRMCRLLAETGLQQDAHLTLPSGTLEQELEDPADAKYWHTVQQPLRDQDWDLYDPNWSPYQDAWLNVVTESSCQDGVFITEKTWKCIAIGQLFVMVGGRGTMAHLRSLGFDTFDDIIPHSRYDYVTGYRARCDAIAELLLSLQNLDWSAIYKSTHQRRLNNQQRFLDRSAYDPYLIRLTRLFDQ